MDRTTRFGAFVFFAPYAIMGWVVMVMFGLGMLAVVFALLAALAKRFGI